jgi:hypothetical protein
MGPDSPYENEAEDERLRFCLCDAAGVQQRCRHRWTRRPIFLTMKL